MSPKDVVFTTKPFEYEAFVTTISDSKTVPSFEELRTKVLNQESRLHRIQAAQHSEQQSAFVSQTSAASDNRSSRSNYNGARNNNGRNQQLILRIALPSPYSQVTLTSSPHLSVKDPLPLATNKDSQEWWDCLRGLNPLDSGQEDTFNPWTHWQCLAFDGFESLENNVVFRQEHLPPCYPPRERGFLEYAFQCAHASDEPSCVIKHVLPEQPKRMRSTSVLVLNICSRNPWTSFSVSSWDRHLLNGFHLVGIHLTHLLHRLHHDRSQRPEQWHMHSFLGALPRKSGWLPHLESH